RSAAPHQRRRSRPLVGPTSLHGRARSSQTAGSSGSEPAMAASNTVTRRTTSGLAAARPDLTDGLQAGINQAAGTRRAEMKPSRRLPFVGAMLLPALLAPVAAARPPQLLGSSLGQPSLFGPAVPSVIAGARLVV